MASESAPAPAAAASLRRPTVVVLLCNAMHDSLTWCPRDGETRPADVRPNPIALLRVDGRPLVRHWRDAFRACDPDGTSFVLATNAHTYKQFERWAASEGIPVSRVVNNGLAVGDCRTGLDSVRVCVGLTSGRDSAAAGSGAEVGDAAVAPDVIIVAADACPGSFSFTDTVAAQWAAFKTHGVSRCVVTKGAGSRPVMYFISHTDAVHLRPTAVTPGETVTTGPDGVLDVLRAAAATVTQGTVDDFAFGGDGSAGRPTDAGGAGSVRALAVAATGTDDSSSPWGVAPPADALYSRGYARVGLMGNPSDGFHGKTVSFTLHNYYAEVWVWESPTVIISPHPLYDPFEFLTLEQLHAVSSREGYVGGRRVLMATAKKFLEQCRADGVELPMDRGFTVKYDTNIPRQVGLAGSSAIITAFFKAILKFYGFHEDPSVIGLPLVKQPSFVLAVETDELGVAAGLQDRVVQVYGGVVFMDFEKELVEAEGHGRYEALPASVLPPLYLAFAPLPSDSGKIHMPVRQRWLDGDAEVLKGMADLAAGAQRLRDDLATDSPVHDRIGELMTRNFTLRRSMYGEHLGATNMRLVQIAEDGGAHAKFSGSGGAAIVFCGTGDDATAKARELQRAYEAEGFVLVRLEPCSNDFEP